MINVKIINQKFSKVNTELAVVTMFKDIVPLKGYIGDLDWLLCANISSLVKSEKIFGTYKEVTLLNSMEKMPADKILIFGLGQSKKITPSKVFNAYSSIAKIILKIKVNDFTFGLFFRESSNLEYKVIAENMMGGLLEELSRADMSENYSIKIVEEDKKKLHKLKTTTRKFLMKYKKSHCKLDLES